MKFKRFLIAASLAGATGLASAATPDPVLLAPAGPGAFSGSFTQAVEGLFIDTFSFMPASFSGRVSVSLAGVSGPVSFFTAELNGLGFSFFPELGADNFSFQANVTADTPLSLTVFGAVLDADGNPGGAGSYRGSIMAAIPEPQTYALLLAGLLAVSGVAARRRARAG